VVSIPLYTDAVYYSILQRELTEVGAETSLNRPPFAFMYRYVGSMYGSKELEDLEQIDTYITETAVDTINLPHELTVRYVRTDNFRLFPQADVAYADVRDPLEWISFAFADNFADKITIVEGGLPAVADTNPDSPVEVLVSEALADELGIQAGELYATFHKSQAEDSTLVVQVPVRVAGIWKATDSQDPYWFYRQSVFDKQFFVPEETFLVRLGPIMDDEVSQALWYLVMDGAAINTDDVGRLLGGIAETQRTVDNLLVNTRMEVSPFDALRRYNSLSRLLNLLLYAYGIPIFGLLLAFIILVVGLSVERQRNEIAVLRSRGATVGQVLGIALVEALILGAIALLLGIPIGRQIAYVISSTRSFLNFTVESDLRITVSMTTIRFGLAAVMIMIFAQVVPSIGASRHTIISYKRERARTLRAPWWQRAWLDVLLLIPAVYGAYLLRQQGSITAPGEIASASTPFENPLLFLVPALGALALTLLVLRILPWIMAGLAWISARGNGVGFLLATRYLSRDPGFYTAPLVLLILTLSLSTFTATLAQTLDDHLYDQSYYRVGADIRLTELGQAADESSSTPGALGGGAADAAESSSDSSVIPETRWVFIPVSEHLNVPGINAAARVGDYGARVQVRDNWIESRFIGLDRIDFPDASYWRKDFAPASLGALMNALAVAPDGILLPRELMADNGLRVGDRVRIQVSSYSARTEVPMIIVGELDYFPTWYEPEDGPLIVGNLEHIFEALGGQVPYNVWAETDSVVDYEQMMTDLRELDLSVADWRSPILMIAEEQRKPSRQGLFGVLSVGFIAAALLTVLGFLLYALFSFRRRFIELGTLRAIGLSPIQMTAFLAWELIFLIVLGLVAGTILGVVISQAFIPYLQVGNDITDLIPPFQVEIAWSAIMRIYALFGILFVVALSVLAVLLLRMKIFQAIKLGETV